MFFAVCDFAALTGRRSMLPALGSARLSATVKGSRGVSDLLCHPPVMAPGRVCRVWLMPRCMSRRPEELQQSGVTVEGTADSTPCAPRSPAPISTR